MTAAYFADLDGTTLFSRRRVESGKSLTGLVIVECLRDEPLSYMSFDAVTLLNEMSRELTFVPTTTRDQVQFERVQIPGIRSRYAIVANGGRILVDGAEDVEWAESTAELARTAAPMQLVLDEVTAASNGAPWLHLVRPCSGLFVYFVAKRGETVPPEFAAYIERSAREWGYTISVQERSTYLIPAGLTKERGAAEVARRLGADKTFASGDSLLDVGLMLFADHAVRPNHGELDGLNLRIDVTERSGLDAGEEILRYIASRL
jgi:hypothetical protein